MLFLCPWNSGPCLLTLYGQKQLKCVFSRRKKPSSKESKKRQNFHFGWNIPLISYSRNHSKFWATQSQRAWVSASATNRFIRSYCSPYATITMSHLFRDRVTLKKENGWPRGPKKASVYWAESLGDCFKELIYCSGHRPHGINHFLKWLILFEIRCRHCITNGVKLRQKISKSVS